MELPFDYIVLYIMKMLDDRNMALSINKSDLITIFDTLVDKMHFTKDEKEEMDNYFDFEYSLDSFLTKYYDYFDLENKCIVFDNDYIIELESLLEDAALEFECKWLILDINYLLDNETCFLEILGVKINKELYNFLLNIDCELEEMYMSLFNLETNSTKNASMKDEIVQKIKKLIFKRMIFLINTKNLLTDVQYKDLVNYSLDVAEKNNDYDDIMLLLETEDFGENDIMCNVFNKSIFTASDMCFSSLSERLGRANLKNGYINYSKIKFYLTFLELLEDDMDKRPYITDAFNEIKYRLMMAIDTYFDVSTIINRNILDGIEYKENYVFAEIGAFYFIKELLMYDDDKYKNVEYDTDNMMLYIDNLVKKIYIETYYKITGNRKIIDAIKGNELYGVNKISSGFLEDIINKHKTKIKEV